MEAEFCRDKIAVYKRLRGVEFAAHLPRTPGPAGSGTGKLLQRALREKVLPG